MTSVVKDYVKSLKPASIKQEKRSDTTGRLLCSCGKGYACEEKDSEYYGKCRLCWVRSLTRREMKERGIKSRC